MNILTKSNSEILNIAEPIWDDIVKGANGKNWDLFSKHMPETDQTDEAKQDVENQWEQVPLLTSLTDKKEFVGILRRKDSVLVLWRQWSSKEDGEFLGTLNLQSINSEVKSIGMFIS
ncbi:MULTISPECIES: hypothetical protein [unclassified Colwellia]|uniref:hypothetical protein n=1 Tax=unclassified Colwellia TaxID=196834 RepID=UPI0015F452DD|nr:MULTISPECIES: hypothetical protein [unclassified Colwellia]MBA6231434.1 hypothetical protein [Colwellia sp. MB02u-7]MBA6235343.1 hypothetical protein [Colwellia sp. MB02u-11]MBA6297996.1 hypothetical protein [Colwellia sp. MB3u-22]MBA6309624.1 hypothetical protein [Colwellia sp. MB3u-64]